MKFYKAKQQDKPILVTISLTVDGKTHTEVINSDSIPEFQVKELTSRYDLFNSITLYYYINEIDNTKRQVITALAVDDRSHVVTIISEDNMPLGYEMVFLLFSETFLGDIDASRQNLTMDEPQLNQVKLLFRDAISDVINEQFPCISAANTQKKQTLENLYPHLSGYFEEKAIGFSSQADVLKKAQEQYFRDQREVLGATELSDEQFQKSFILSARALAEYIMFRQNVIKKMRAITPKNKEADIHNLIAPMKEEFRAGEFMHNLYRNNVWVLDDKFMSYCTVLSDLEMSKVINVLTEGEVKNDDDDRPDIVMFFSGDPTKEGNMVDVVVVELKRLGLTLEQNSIVDVQLETRTIRLAEYFNKRIQRIWFYGVVEFDDDFERFLVNKDFNPLFSTGNVYFRSKQIFTDKTKQNSVIQNAYILDYTALVEDASTRNETFLKILQKGFTGN